MLDVQIDRLTGVYKNMTHGIVTLVFRCHVVNGTPHSTAEARETAWLAPAEVRERMSERSPFDFSTRSTAPSMVQPVVATTALTSWPDSSSSPSSTPEA